jgi:hypothetical protein
MSVLIGLMLIELMLIELMLIELMFKFNFWVPSQCVYLMRIFKAYI